ncbi:MAG: phosphatase PAP2 family protein [Rhodoglobus sp.]
MIRTRRLALVGGIAALAAVLLLGGLTVLRGTPFGFDSSWMAEITEHRSDLWLVPSLVMNFIGGGWFAIFVVPLGGALALFLLGRRWAALYFVLVSALSAGAVQLLKVLFGRARPEDILVTVDPGSFPSGHVANAATVAVALALIFQRTWLWVVAVAWIVLMALSRTYLGAHWVSDTLGGAVLGAAVAVILWAVLALRIHPVPPAVARAESGGSDSHNLG